MHLNTSTWDQDSPQAQYHLRVSASGRIPRDRTAEQSLSGRGGASGIGIHGFYVGGVLCDAGRANDHIDRLLPSGAGPATSLPLLMFRQPFPASWRVGLCLPGAELSHGLDERRFFEMNAPVPRIEALETMAILYHGLMPAFRLQSLELLASTLMSISNVGFKRLEIERCGENVINLLGDLLGKGYAAGMSSMGPLVYVIFATDDERASVELQELCAARNARWLGCHSGLNRGATIRRARAA